MLRVADGTTDNAAAIQAAINGCAANGGGLVRLLVAGKGIYVSSPITLTRHVGLHLDAGVILRGTNGDVIAGVTPFFASGM